jgi:hypothetical protein
LVGIGREWPAATSSDDERTRSGSSRRRQSLLLFEIEIENSHVEIIRKLAILIVTEDHADELIADIDFRRIVLLRALADFDIGELEFGPEKPGELLYFIGLQNGIPCYRGSPSSTPPVEGKTSLILRRALSPL